MLIKIKFMEVMDSDFTAIEIITDKKESYRNWNENIIEKTDEEEEEETGMYLNQSIIKEVTQEQLTFLIDTLELIDKVETDEVIIKN